MRSRYSPTYDKGMSGEATIGIVIIVVFILALIVGTYFDYGGSATYKGYTVTDKTVKNDGDSSKYLIYTKKDNEVMVFSIEDRFWIGRLDSSDDYARIEIGATYNFETVGLRNHLFSSYPSIIEMEKID